MVVTMSLSCLRFTETQTQTCERAGACVRARVCVREIYLSTVEPNENPPYYYATTVFNSKISKPYIKLFKLKTI